MGCEFINIQSVKYQRLKFDIFPAFNQKKTYNHNITGLCYLLIFESGSIFALKRWY